MRHPFAALALVAALGLPFAAPAQEADIPMEATELANDFYGAYWRLRSGIEAGGRSVALRDMEAMSVSPLAPALRSWPLSEPGMDVPVEEVPTSLGDCEGGWRVVACDIGPAEEADTGTVESVRLFLLRTEDGSWRVFDMAYGEAGAHRYLSEMLTGDRRP